MAYGVQVNASNGNKLFDTSDNIQQYIAEGTFTITNGQSTSNSITVAGLTTSDRFDIIVNKDHQPFYDNQQYGETTISSGSFTFQRQSANGNADTTNTYDYRYIVLRTA